MRRNSGWRSAGTRVGAPQVCDSVELIDRCANYVPLVPNLPISL